jgi:hypothetical protein
MAMMMRMMSFVKDFFHFGKSPAHVFLPSGTVSMDGVNKNWQLSERTSVRCGLLKGKVVLRVSNENELLEERPHSPPGFGSVTTNADPRKTYKSVKYYDLDVETAYELAKTVFLSCDEVEGLEDLLLNFVKVPVHGSACCGGRKDTLCPLRLQDGRNSCYGYAGEYAEILGNCGTIKILTFKTVESNPSRRINNEFLGQVELVEDEILKFKEIIPEVYEHCRMADVCIVATAEIVYKTAGEVLSRMLYSKYGAFDSTELRQSKVDLHCAFLAVYGEFMGMGYVDSVATKVSEMWKESKYCLFDLKTVVRQLLSQPNELFRKEILASPVLPPAVREGDDSSCIDCASVQ